MASKFIVGARKTLTSRYLEDPASIEQLIQQVKALPGCSIHCSIDCKPWSQWQRLNQRKYLRLSASFRQERDRSEELLKQFIRVGNARLDNGGEYSFEWPRYCSGWALPCLQEWILERNLRSATFDGCAVGVEADGKPAKKPWRVVSSSSRLVENLAAQKCTHTRHEPLQGKWTRMSAFYPRKLSEIMVRLPTGTCAPCHVLREFQHPHRQKLVAGYPFVPLDVAMSHVGCKELVTPAYVHRLLDRSEWKDRPEVLEATNSEKQGVLTNGTWDESKIRPKAGNSRWSSCQRSEDTRRGSSGDCQHEGIWEVACRMVYQSSHCVSWRCSAWRRQSSCCAWRTGRFCTDESWRSQSCKCFWTFGWTCFFHLRLHQLLCPK